MFEPHICSERIEKGIWVETHDNIPRAQLEECGVDWVRPFRNRGICDDAHAVHLREGLVENMAARSTGVAQGATMCFRDCRMKSEKICLVPTCSKSTSSASFMFFV